jgi:uncharacterized membrane protein
VLHLLHPALVHLSVAFLGVGGACEAWAILRHRPGVERWAGVLVVVGTLSLLPTIVTGYLAKNSVDLPASAVGDLELHERLGLTLAGVFVASQFWKAWGGGRISPRYRTWYAALLLAGVVVLVVGAVLGGELVYGHGVGVNSS